MSNKIKNDLILRVARGEKTEDVPVWVMRQAGRYLPEYMAMRAKYDFFTLCQTPELAMRITMQPLERFPQLDAAIIFCDILVIPQCMGFDIKMIKGRGPVFSLPLTDIPSLVQEYSGKEKEVISSKLSYVSEAIKLTVQELNGRCPLIGFVGAPWTLAAYMIEGGGSKTYAKAKKLLIQEPTEFNKLMALLTDYCAEFLIAQAAAGASLLQIFDSWGGALSPKIFREKSFPWLKKLIKTVKTALPDIPIVLFVMKAHASMRMVCEESGADVIGIDWSYDLDDITLPQNIAIQGNLDPFVLFASDAEIRLETTEMKRKMEKLGLPWIANLGHGMMPDMNPEKLSIFLTTMKQKNTRA